jgi:arginine decarboxylase
MPPIRLQLQGPHVAIRTGSNKMHITVANRSADADAATGIAAARNAFARAVAAPATSAATAVRGAGEGVGARGIAVHLASGTGRGPTKQAAFDAALRDAGVADAELFHLSSVIPPNARIACTRHVTPPHEQGKRLCVVLAQMRQSEPGRQAHAGVGWVQAGEGGPGLFVQLHDENRDQLEHDLHATLDDSRRRRAAGHGPVRILIASQRCGREPVCALVVAVYACERWQ